jgi:Uma2 family endonuclease
MGKVKEEPTTAPAAPPPHRIYLENLRWSTFKALLADLGDHRGRLTFDRGALEIVSPGQKHEHVKKLIGRFIETLTEELDIKLKSVSSTTLIREDLERAAEADECYYIAHEPEVREREDLDLDRDPPPDLAVEIEITRRVLSRLPIYASMGVPEVWSHDGKALKIRILEGDRYVFSTHSKAFPMLPIPGLERFLAKRGSVDETGLVRSFRAWVRGGFQAGPLA